MEPTSPSPEEVAAQAAALRLQVFTVPMDINVLRTLVQVAVFMKASRPRPFAGHPDRGISTRASKRAQMGRSERTLKYGDVLRQRFQEGRAKRETLDLLAYL